MITIFDKYLKRFKDNKENNIEVGDLILYNYNYVTHGNIDDVKIKIRTGEVVKKYDNKINKKNFIIYDIIRLDNITADNGQSSNDENNIVSIYSENFVRKLTSEEVKVFDIKKNMNNYNL